MTSCVEAAVIAALEAILRLSSQAGQTQRRSPQQLGTLKDWGSMK